MLRIRLPTGEELDFLSLEEFSSAVLSGTVNSEATIFHAKTERWLPVSSHPAYRRVMATMPLPGPTPTVGDRSGAAHTALVAPSPLYAEPRRQPSRGAEGLGRPDDARSDWLVLFLASMLVAGMVCLTVKRPFAAPSAGEAPEYEVTSALAWTGLGTQGSLALHHVAREERLVAQMNGRLRALALPRPLLPAAVETPQLLDQTLARLREARDTINAYRRRAASLDRAYSDSTGRVGQNDAAASAPLLAAPDSAYALAELLTVLLVGEKGRFRSSDDTVTFERPAQAAEYDRLREMLADVYAQFQTNPRLVMLADPLPGLPTAAPRP